MPDLFNEGEMPGSGFAFHGDEVYICLTRAINNEYRKETGSLGSGVPTRARGPTEHPTIL